MNVNIYLTKKENIENENFSHVNASLIMLDFKHFLDHLYKTFKIKNVGNIKDYIENEFDHSSIDNFERLIEDNNVEISESEIAKSLNIFMKNDCEIHQQSNGEIYSDYCTIETYDFIITL